MDVRTTLKSLFFLAICLYFPTWIGISPLAAQSIRVVVNGEAITALDISIRGRLLALSTGKEQTAAVEKEATKELIEEKLILQEARTRSVPTPDALVEQQFASIASSNGLSPKQFAEALSSAGTTEASFKARIASVLTWQQLTRSHIASRISVSEQDIVARMFTNNPDRVSPSGTRYFTLTPVIFLLSKNPGASEVARRKREAEALRQRFRGCSDGTAFAARLNSVIVQPSREVSEIELPDALRSLVGRTPVGRLTQPQTTGQSVEMLAVCSVETRLDNAGEMTSIRLELLKERQKKELKRFLLKLRRNAVIEHR